MASAIVFGLLARRRYRPEEIICIGSPDDDSAEQLAKKTRIQMAKDPYDLLERARTLVVACKPQQLRELDPAYAQKTKGCLILSILAGTPIVRLREAFPEAHLIARAMPNTPAQVGEGITGLAWEHSPAAPDRDILLPILEATGEVVEVEEDTLHEVTAISGSGPAYVFEFTAALRDAGIKLGLDPKQAQQLALQTVSGAAKLMQETGDDPEALRDRVSSPGGTTLAGLEALTAHGFREAVESCAQAAWQRSKELAEEA